MKWTEITDDIELNLPVIWKKNLKWDSFVYTIADLMAHETCHFLLPKTNYNMKGQEIAIRLLLDQNVDQDILSFYDEDS